MEVEGATSKFKDIDSIVNCHRSAMLLKHQIIMIVMWMVSAMFFYGLSYSSTSLSGSPYLNLFYSGLAEVLSYASMIPILKASSWHKLCGYIRPSTGPCIIVCIIVYYICTACIYIIQSGTNSSNILTDTLTQTA